VSQRAQQLHDTVDGQLAELAERLSATGEEALTRPCPGREKLGDGTVGAVAAHTIDNYHRIAGFLADRQHEGEHHQPGRHGEAYQDAELELGVLLARLAAARDALATIGQLSDEQLESVPPAGSMRFADGERTLEQIVASLLKHQRHQVDALTAGST
jgi:hypothetical protein